MSSDEEVDSVRDASAQFDGALEALTEFKKRNGIERIVTSMPANFDEPLPEDVLLKPLPPERVS
jgi:hypothetical protein